MTDLNETAITRHNPKPMEEEEEEEEEYAPPVRPQRYIYKYHRVGTASLEKIAGPATTPPTTTEMETAMESTSLSTENSSLVTKVPENPTEEMATIEQKQPTTLADGDIHLENSLGFSHADLPAEPTAISSLPTTLTEGQALSEAAPVEEASIIATHGDIVANFDYVSQDAALTLQLTGGDSTANLPQEGIPSEPVEQTEVANTSSPEIAAPNLVGIEPTGPLPEVNNAPSAESTSHDGVNQVIAGLTQDSVAIVSGVTPSASDVLQCSHEGTQEVINGITLDKVEILGGLSAVLAEQQQSPEKATDILTKAAGEDMVGNVNADASSGDLGTLSQPNALPEHEHVHLQESVPHHTTEGDLLPQELPHERDTCGVVEVISGVTSDNMAVVSGLSSICTSLESKDEKHLELPPIKVIVSGITATGVEIISGLAFEHTVKAASSDAQVHFEDSSAHSTTPLQVVCGLTSDNQQIFAGIAMNVPGLDATSGNHADIPFVEVQKAPDVITADVLQSESNQVPLHPSYLPPVDVPMRSDSF